jgi:hypothetical protein
MHDAIHDISLVVALPQGAYTTDQTGATIDLAGYSGAAIFAVPAAIAGTHAVVVQESANGTTWSNVGAGDLIGALASLSANTPQKVSYVGNKRYIRALSTSTGGTGNFGVVVLRRSSRVLPAA